MKLEMVIRGALLIFKGVTKFKISNGQVTFNSQHEEQFCNGDFLYLESDIETLKSIQ